MMRDIPSQQHPLYIVWSVLRLVNLALTPNTDTWLLLELSILTDLSWFLSLALAIAVYMFIKFSQLKKLHNFIMLLDNKKKCQLAFFICRKQF